jgi:tetratricopeptide (TPR) repeat protein
LTSLAHLRPERSTSRRPSIAGLIGIALGAVAIPLPWLTIPLAARQTAFSVPLDFAGLPRVGAVSYGLLATAAIALAVVGTVRGRGRGSALLGLAGAVLLLLPLLMVAQLTLWDAAGYQALADRVVDRNLIEKQFGYAVGSEPLTTLGLLALPASGQVVANSLARGWFLAATAGALMLWAGFRPLRESARSRPRPAAMILVAGSACLLLLAGRGVLAQLFFYRGTTAALALRPDAATERLGMAELLNPSLAQARDFELVLGAAQLAAGDTRTAPALLAQAEASGQTGDHSSQLGRLLEAHAAAPQDPVVSHELTVALIQAKPRRLIQPEDGSGLLTGLAADDSPAVQYTSGRTLFSLGDYATARTRFLRVLGLTSDADVRSSALTYLALCDFHGVHPDLAKHELVEAIKLDTGYNNTLARTVATGLYAGTIP